MLENLREAASLAARMVVEKTGDPIFEMMPVQSGKHFIIRTDSGQRYWVIFKREFFLSFADVFSEQAAPPGPGESVNLASIQWAMRANIEHIIFVYERGSVYTIGTRRFFEHALRHGFRRQTGGGEETLSVPVRELLPWV